MYPTRFSNYLKKRVLEMAGAKIGSNPFIHMNVFISNPSKISLGDNIVLSKGVILISEGYIEIGNNVMIGYDSKLLSSDHIILPGKSTRFTGHEKSKIVIGEDSWIASNAVISKGVTLREMTVVGSYAFVNNSFNRSGLLIGQPARMVKYYEKN